VGLVNYCTTSRNSTLAYLADASDKEVIIYRFKRGFFCGICIEKGLGVLWAKVKETVVSAIRRHDGRVYL